MTKKGDACDERIDQECELALHRSTVIERHGPHAGSA